MLDRNELLMIKLCDFFRNNPKSIILIDELLNKQSSSITLRVIDWFVTYYCKYKSNECYRIYISYKLQLKSFSKKLFDPFCRGDRIDMLLSEDIKINTTVAQLNFFKWLYDCDVIEYYEKYKNKIEHVMIEDGFKIKFNGRGRMKKKRKETIKSKKKELKQDVLYTNSCSSGPVIN